MDEIIRDLLVSVVAIGAIFGILYVFLMTRYKERMALMDRGLSPKEFNNKNSAQSAVLRFGLLLTGISIGIMSGNFVAKHFDVPREGAFIAMMFLFGGISLIVSYLIEKRSNKS
jgi:hypothetical protein